MDFSSHPPLRRPTGHHKGPNTGYGGENPVTAGETGNSSPDSSPPPQLSPGFYSSVFVVLNMDRGWRPIINLRELNRYVISPHFKMENISNSKDVILPGEWTCEIDLKDAHLMHRSDWRFLCFSWKEECYQFKTLPFGLTLAPCLPNSSAQLLHCSGRMV